MIARMIERGDEEQVADLALQMHAESRYAYLPFERSRVLQVCEAALTLPYYKCAVLASDKALSGFVAVSIEPYVSCTLRVARDLAMYIEPSKRSYINFSVLMGHIEGWCQDHGIAAIDFTVSAPPDDVDAVRYGKLWMRRGYQWYGTNYVKEL